MTGETPVLRDGEVATGETPVLRGLRRALAPHLAWGGLICALMLMGCEEAPTAVVVPPYPQAEKLVVVTPHNEMIRGLFERAFSDWHYEQHKKYVEIDWISMGTPQCVAYVQETAQSDAAHAGRSVPDVMFGGGVIDHGIIAEKGLAKAVNLGELESELPASIAGIATRDDQNRWHSSALSGFGILVNKKGCQQRGIAEPATWADLADPRFYGWVALADPERSGSNRQCLTIILQKYGWEKGWGIILRAAANCRAMASGSEEVITSTSSGSCLAGFSVNFTALRAVEERGKDVLGYINPADASAITPDVLTVLNHGSHPEVAERFVRFCVGDDGQKAWGVKAESRGGYNDTLYRYPINPKFYRDFKDQISVTDNPLEMKSILALDQQLEQRQAAVVAPLLLAACGDNHVKLQTCWRRIIDAGLPSAALAELEQPVVAEADAYARAADLQQGGEAAQGVIKAWADLFTAKYERLLAMLPGT